MGGNYLAWKWRNLQKRREFYFYLFNLFLAFIWLSISSYINHDSYNFHTTTPNPFSLTCLLICCFHFLYFFSFCYPLWIQKIINEKPKMSYFTYLSFILSSWVLVFLRQNSMDTDPSTPMIVSFLLTIEMGIGVVHHMGMANPFIAIVKMICAVLWIIFLSFTKLPAPVVIAALLAFFINHSIGVTVEQELVRTFTKLDIIEESSNDKYNISKDFAKDFLKALVEIDTLLLKQLHEIGLPIESKGNINGTNNNNNNNTNANNTSATATTSTNGVASPTTSTVPSLKAHHRHRSSNKLNIQALTSQAKIQGPKVFRFTSIMTQCLEMKYLKNALYHSLASSTTVDKSNYDKFFFHKMSRFVFALFESSAQHSLPLFLENHSKEVMITAPQEIFQLIIYLLIHDFVKGKKTGVCMVTCENSGEHWELHLKLSYPEITNESNTPSGRAVDEEDRSTDGSDSLVLKKILPPSALVPNLLSETNPVEDTTSMERLADRIFYRYFRKRIDKTSMEVREGVSFYHKVVPLSKSYFTVTEKTLPPSTNPVNPTAGNLGNPSASNLHGRFSSASTYQQAANSFVYDQLAESQWILLGFKLQETGLLPYLKEKLQALYLPISLVSIDEYKSILTTYKSQNTSQIKKNILLIVPESHLNKFNVENDLPIIKAFSREIIVVCDISTITPTTLATVNNRYDIKASYILKPKPTLAELLSLVKMMSKKIEPRPIVNDEFLFPLFGISEKQLASLANNANNGAAANENTPPPAPASPAQPLSTNSSSAVIPIGASTSPLKEVKKHGRKSNPKEKSSNTTAKTSDMVQPLVALLTKLLTDERAGLTLASKKIIENRLKQLSNESISSLKPRKSFNYELLQTYLKKRKSSVTLTSLPKQKAEFITTFFTTYVTLMQQVWKRDSNLSCVVALIQEMEKKSRFFRLVSLTLTIETVKDVMLVAQQQYLPSSEVTVQIFSTSSFQTNANQEEEDKLRSGQGSTDPNTMSEENKSFLLPSQMLEEDGEGEMKLFDISHFDDEELTKQHQQISAKEAMKKYELSPLPKESRADLISSPSVGSDTEDDDLQEKLLKIVKSFQNRCPSPEKLKSLPLAISESIEEGLILLRSAIWESAFEE